MSKQIHSALVDELIKLAIRPHYSCGDDRFYSCPKSPEGCANDQAGSECNCGADEHNAKVAALAERIKG